MGTSQSLILDVTLPQQGRPQSALSLSLVSAVGRSWYPWKICVLRHLQGGNLLHLRATQNMLDLNESTSQDNAAQHFLTLTWSHNILFLNTGFVTLRWGSRQKLFVKVHWMLHWGGSFKGRRRGSVNGLFPGAMHDLWNDWLNNWVSWLTEWNAQSSLVRLTKWFNEYGILSKME